MKKLIMLMLVAAATAGVQAQTISWNENNGGNVPAPSGTAGAVAATNWNCGESSADPWQASAVRRQPDLERDGRVRRRSIPYPTSTNVALPMASWIPVWTNVFALDGSYSYTNSPLTDKANFFRLVTP